MARHAVFAWGVVGRSRREAGGMGRRARILITAGVVGALVAPVVLDRDGFPLSTYPMYSRARGDAVTFATAQAVDRQRGDHDADARRDR